MKKTVNRKKNQKIKNWVNSKISFVGKVESKGRIVLYNGRVLEDLGETIKCEMIDRYIKADKTPFIEIFTKKQVKIY